MYTLLTYLGIKTRENLNLGRFQFVHWTKSEQSQEKTAKLNVFNKIKKSQEISKFWKFWLKWEKHRKQEINRFSTKYEFQEFKHKGWFSITIYKNTKSFEKKWTDA